MEANRLVPATNRRAMEANRLVPDTNRRVMEANRFAPDTNRRVMGADRFVPATNGCAVAVDPFVAGAHTLVADPRPLPAATRTLAAATRWPIATTQASSAITRTLAATTQALPATTQALPATTQALLAITRTLAAAMRTSATTTRALAATEQAPTSATSGLARRAARPPIPIARARSPRRGESGARPGADRGGNGPATPLHSRPRPRMPPARRTFPATPSARRAEVIDMSKLSHPLRPFARARGRAWRALTWLPAAVACAALAPARAADWAQFQSDAGHTGHNAAETAFTPDNVTALRVAWRAHVGTNDVGDAGPVIAGGQLFMGGLDGTFAAFDLAGCGADICEPLWRGHGVGFAGTPGVSNGVVAAPSADGFLYVFSAQGCGQADCEPLWRGRLRGASNQSSVALVGGQAFVGDVRGQLSVFDLAGCGQSVCDPVWAGRGGIAREHQFGTPAIGAGFVFVQTTIDEPRHDTGRLLAFPLGGCGHATCAPAWVADLGAPVALVSAPVVAGDKVIVGTVEQPRRGAQALTEHTRIVAFAAAGCGHFVCPPVQTFEGMGKGFQVGMATSVDGTTLFATSSESFDQHRTAVVAAYDLAHCGASCGPTWRSEFHGPETFTPPAVAGDVVFVGKGGNRREGVLAFDARGCGKATCEPLVFARSASSSQFSGAPLAIADGNVALGDDDDPTAAGYVEILRLP
jgi:hypothetical protein